MAEAACGRFRGADGLAARKKLGRHASSSSQHFAASHRKRGIWNERVVVIDDDRGENGLYEEEEEEDDDDDCKITGCSKAPKLHQSKRVGAKRPAQWKSRNASDTATANTATTDTADTRTTAAIDLSDCEVEIGAHSDIRKQWEEAAKKRKKFQSFAATKGSSAGKVAGGVSEGPNERKQCSGESVSTSKGQASDPDAGQVESKEQEEPDFLATFFEAHSKNQGLNGTYKKSPSPLGSRPSSSNADFFQEHTRDFKEHLRSCQGHGPVSNGFGDTRRTPPLKRSNDSVVRAGAENRVLPDSEVIADRSGGTEFIADREKVKQSDEFKKADEEEWQRRQEELQRQAQEAQKLKKRRKAEAERQLAMQSRQRERLEQIRENQIQEMKTNGIKDVMRGQIQFDLERKVAGCIDMATVLHRLGIPVEGGVQCTPEQVNAAYKKAILRFHPDRAAATANNDPRRQVEAEETFKLITKLKALLQLVPPLKPRPVRK